MMRRLRKIIRKRKWLLLVSIIALLVISDLLIAWYTANYTTEDKTAGIQTT
jgi:cell division protein FtsL